MCAITITPGTVGYSPVRLVQCTEIMATVDYVFIIPATQFDWLSKQFFFSITVHFKVKAEDIDLCENSLLTTIYPVFMITID